MHWRRSIARRHRPGRPNLAGPHRRAATYMDQYSGGETVRLVCASEYRKLECAAIAAAFETVWVARLAFLRSCAGGCVLAVDFAPLAPSFFAIFRADGCVLAVDFAPLAPSFFAIFRAGGCVLAVDFAPLAPSPFATLRAVGGRPPRLAAYSLPSIAPTCGGSRSRYGRPTPSSVSCRSIHFHRSSLAANRCRRVSPLTLTRSTASPWP